MIGRSNERAFPTDFHPTLTNRLTAHCSQMVERMNTIIARRNVGKSSRVPNSSRLPTGASTMNARHSLNRTVSLGFRRPAFHAQCATREGTPPCQKSLVLTPPRIQDNPII